MIKLGQLELYERKEGDANKQKSVFDVIIVSNFKIFSKENPRILLSAGAFLLLAYDCFK